MSGVLPATREEATTAGLKRYKPVAPCARGHDSPRYASNGHCVECTTAGYRQWRKKPESRPKLREHQRRTRANPAYKAKERETAARWRAEKPSSVLVWHAKNRAKAAGIPFDLKPEDIPVPDTCPILGIPLRRGAGRIGPNSPTLDRKVPALGYVRGNCAVISSRANRLKSDASIEELRALVRWMES